MRLPNFLIIGAAKCATTSLASLLELHPDAAIAKGKEPHFFSYDERYKMGIDSYGINFSHCKNETAIGDASTSYSRLRQHPKTISRIKQHLGTPKIIYMVRHPINRIESAYIEQMTELQNSNIRSINQAILQRPMMVDSSRYWETYKSYAKVFGINKIKIIWFEEYIDNIPMHFSDVCDFLSIDNSFTPDLSLEKENSQTNAATRIPANVKLDTKWQSSLLKKIKTSLRPDTTAFLNYFGKPADYWKY